MSELSLPKVTMHLKLIIVKDSLYNNHFSLQECFLRFMACLLRNYRAYLVPIQANSSSVTATDSTKLFDIDGFQRSKERAYHKYYSSILRTQMFSRFIEENSLGSPGRDESLAFFEECTQLVDDSRDQPALLERDRAVASEHTKLVMPPEPTDPDRNILYDGIFPLLDEVLLRQEESNESESNAPRCILKQLTTITVSAVSGNRNRKVRG